MHPDSPADRLCALARSWPTLMQALAAARELALTSWCIGAGAVRNRVWDHLHERLGLHDADGTANPTGGDIDLVFFDPQLPPEHDHALRQRLLATHPEWDWDVTNQAHVHRWYQRADGQPVPPLRSLAEGVATWPEYATCVGLTLTADNALHVVAPHGLDDLFALRVRHNPARTTAAQFTDRYTRKGWLQRWPRLTVVPPPGRLAG